ncbi:DUF2252 family protein [Dyella sp.]|uniref:DUF2252 family protein n=1 Tax=Dyella sp. TaxID=1869338 RepID=UPI002ED34304
MSKTTKRPFRPSERGARLTQLRNLKMSRSAHAYVRGSTVQFYEWLDEHGAELPQGPAIWICGDCHVSNLGPIVDAKGDVAIQIRDLDQTVIGNPAHDLVRLGVSLATAARGSDLPGVVTARMLESLIAGYELALAPSGRQTRELKRPQSVHLLMKRALGRKWKHLAAERIGDMKPELPRSARFWPVSAAERKDIQTLIKSPGVHDLVTDLAHRDASDDIEVLDMAYWVKGCSSLGRLRYAVLLRVGKKSGDDRGLCLLDIKEALKAAAPRSPEAPMPRHNGERVVAGAHALSPNLGSRMLAARVQDTSVFVRELRPEDLKIDLEALTETEAMDAARYLGNVVGRAHASQLDKEQRKAWRAELRRRRPANLESPTWLWKSVVALVQTHEGAYLEHCRRYALGINGAT